MLCFGLDGIIKCVFFFSSRRRHTRLQGDWSSNVCSSDLIQEVEGDAVFAVGPDDTLPAPARFLNVLDSAFAAFKKLQGELAADESCACGACRSIDKLDLKVIAHRGRFL